MKRTVAAVGLVIIVVGLTADLIGLGSYSSMGAVQIGWLIVGALILAASFLMGGPKKTEVSEDEETGQEHQPQGH